MFSKTTNDLELKQILEIQSENHVNQISDNKKHTRGYVTVKHDFETLKTMHLKAPYIIAKADNQVIGYALVMLREVRSLIPVLMPMFDIFDKISYQGRQLKDASFYVMGQVCIADKFKRKGILQKLYHKHREVYSTKFEYIVTEVSSKNIPSMLAHEKVGFKTIHTFTDDTDEWNIILWDWT